MRFTDESFMEFIVSFLLLFRVLWWWGFCLFVLNANINYLVISE